MLTALSVIGFSILVSYLSVAAIIASAARHERKNRLDAISVGLSWPYFIYLRFKKF